ncbi:hypothetical protein Tco_1569400 [Tanacetum coccineum]
MPPIPLSVMPPIPLCIHLATVFQHEAMEEQHWGEYCRRNCMALSERMRQIDAVIGALEQTASREKIVRAVAYLREIQNGDMEKLDWYMTMERIFKSRTKKKAKTKQNQARNGKDKVKGQPSEENTT